MHFTQGGWHEACLLVEPILNRGEADFQGHRYFCWKTKGIKPAAFFRCFSASTASSGTSREHLPRYINEFDFRWNTRKMNDGDRTKLAVQGTQGKRLPYHTIRQ